MRNQQTRIHAVCLAIALFVLAPSVTMAQGAIEKFGENVFGKEKLEAYDADLSKIGQQLREREAGTQRASQTAFTFLVLLRSARSEKEWSVLASLRPTFNAAWKNLVETASMAGQQLQASGFGKELASVDSQGKKIVDDPAAAAEYVLAEAYAVGPYGRSAGNLFSAWQLSRSVGDGDLKQLADASGSGIIEKVEKADTKELQSATEPMLQIAGGCATVAADVFALLRDRSLKTKVLSALSIPEGVSDVVDGIRKFGR